MIWVTKFIQRTHSVTHSDVAYYCYTREPNRWPFSAVQMADILTASTASPTSACTPMQFMMTSLTYPRTSVGGRSAADQSNLPWYMDISIIPVGHGGQPALKPTVHSGMTAGEVAIQMQTQARTNVFDNPNAHHDSQKTG